MKGPDAVVLITLLLMSSLHIISSAPSRVQKLQPFEQSMLDSLHQPWLKPETVPEHPRKGETKCKGVVCKPKRGCEDCQYAKPLGIGSTKPADIPKSQLKYLAFVVQGNGRTRIKYTYWNARNIAKDPRVNFKRKTLLLAVGYLDGPYFPIATMMANEYEAMGYNVIIVDNQRFSTVHYYLASRMMRPVGKHVAEILVQLTELGLNPRLLEVVGFSLGGQTASYIARNYQNMTGRNISTIVSLEPSGPCFRTLDSTDRLDASNADFVQVIHTNIDGFGMATPMGHVDIYVNGGEYQPSELALYPCTSTCSHFRVLALWLAALKYPKKFLAIRCENLQQARDSNCYRNVPQVVNEMGLGVDRSKTGIFYLSTGKTLPYYLGSKGLREEFAYWRVISDVNEGNETEVYT